MHLWMFQLRSRRCTGRFYRPRSAGGTAALGAPAAGSSHPLRAPSGSASACSRARSAVRSRSRHCPLAARSARAAARSRRSGAVAPSTENAGGAPWDPSDAPALAELAGQRLVLDAVRLVRVGAEAALAVGLV